MFPSNTDFKNVNSRSLGAPRSNNEGGFIQEVEVSEEEPPNRHPGDVCTSVASANEISTSCGSASMNDSLNEGIKEQPVLIPPSTSPLPPHQHANTNTSATNNSTNTHVDENGVSKSPVSKFLPSPSERCVEDDGEKVEANESVCVSWVNPKLEARKGKTGCGIYAIAPIKKGEELVVWSGKVVDTDHALFIMETPDKHYILQVGDGFYQIPIFSPYREPADWSNHSCRPTAGFGKNSPICLSARVDLEIGDEVTFDYGMCETDERLWEPMECACGFPECRGLITANDWKLPQLWDKYQGYWAPHVQRLVDVIRAEYIEQEKEKEKTQQKEKESSSSSALRFRSKSQEEADDDDDEDDADRYDDSDDEDTQSVRRSNNNKKSKRKLKCKTISNNNSSIVDTSASSSSSSSSSGSENDNEDDHCDHTRTNKNKYKSKVMNNINKEFECMGWWEKILYQYFGLIRVKHITQV